MGEAEQAIDRLSAQTIRGQKVDVMLDDVSVSLSFSLTLSS